MNAHAPITADKPKRVRKPAAKPSVKAPNSVEAAIAEADRVTTEAAAMQAPVMSRAATARNQVEAEVKGLERDRADFVDRMNLLTAQYTAAHEALGAHVDDIDATIAIKRNGIGPVAEGL